MEIFSIYILFKDAGLCTFYNDADLQVQRIKELNQLSTDEFTHDVFLREPEMNRHMKKESNLFGEGRDTFGIWTTILPSGESEARMAIAIQYEVNDLGKLMPHFVEQLKVPLIAMFETTEQKPVYMRDMSPGEHYATEWTFSEKRFHLPD